MAFIEENLLKRGFPQLLVPSSTYSLLRKWKGVTGAAFPSQAQIEWNPSRAGKRFLIKWHILIPS